MNPQATFAKWDAMFAILPLHIAVARPLKPKSYEAGGDSQPTQPVDHRHINTIRCRIADDETHIAGRITDATQCDPNARQILEITRHHQVVGLLASLRQSVLGKLPADVCDLRTNRIEHRISQHLRQVDGSFRYMLAAGSQQVTTYFRLQFAPASQFAEERHLQSRGVRIIKIVRVRW